MKKFISALLATLAVNASAQSIEREDFVAQLSVESCSASPKKLYLNTENDGFDLAHALSLSWVALQTLDVDPTTLEDDADVDLAAAQENWGLENVKLIDNKQWNVRAMIVDYQDSVFLTFRHTDSNLNWAMNVDMGLWNFDHSFALGEKVHHGFGTMLGSIWGDIVDELRLRTQEGKKVHIFGHSLGAALALLAAPGVEIEGMDVAQVYATGSPKVGSVDWVTNANQVVGGTSIYRLTNSDDFTSRIPLTESSLDEFRAMFSFIPTFFTRFLDNVRYQMPYGVFGDHVTMTKDQQLLFADPLTNEVEEQAYWQGIVDEFIVVDNTSNNIIDNAQKKFGVITSKFGGHPMRTPDIGYACAMTKLLKEGL